MKKPSSQLELFSFGQPDVTTAVHAPAASSAASITPIAALEPTPESTAAEMATPFTGSTESAATAIVNPVTDGALSEPSRQDPECLPVVDDRSFDPAEATECSEPVSSEVEAEAPGEHPASSIADTDASGTSEVPPVGFAEVNLSSQNTSVLSNGNPQDGNGMMADLSEKTKFAEPYSQSCRSAKGRGGESFPQDTQSPLVFRTNIVSLDDQGDKAVQHRRASNDKDEIKIVYKKEKEGAMDSRPIGGSNFLLWDSERDAYAHQLESKSSRNALQEKRNFLSAYKDFLACSPGATAISPAEMTAERSKQFLDLWAAKTQKSETTFPGYKSHLTGFLRFVWSRAKRSFADVLDGCLTTAGMPGDILAQRIDTKASVVAGWLAGRSPVRKSLATVERAELILGLPAGSLTKLCPAFAPCPPKTAYARRQAILRNFRYRLPRSRPLGAQGARWPALLEQQFTRLSDYKRSLEKEGKWTKNQFKRCGSESNYQGLWESFSGWCVLPPSPDPVTSGAGLAVESLSASLFANWALVQGYLKFIAVRAGVNPEAPDEVRELYSSRSVNTVNMINSMLRPETGFIWRECTPSFGFASWQFPSGEAIELTPMLVSGLTEMLPFLPTNGTQGKNGLFLRDDTDRVIPTLENVGTLGGKLIGCCNDAIEQIAGKLTVLRLDLRRSLAPLRQTVANKLSDMLSPAASGASMQIEAVLEQFQRQHPGKMLLIVGHGLKNLLLAHTGERLVDDIDFLQHLAALGLKYPVRFAACVEAPVFGCAAKSPDSAESTEVVTSWSPYPSRRPAAAPTVIVQQSPATSADAALDHLQDFYSELHVRKDLAEHQRTCVNTRTELNQYLSDIKPFVCQTRDVTEAVRCITDQPRPLLYSLDIARTMRDDIDAMLVSAEQKAVLYRNILAFRAQLEIPFRVEQFSALSHRKDNKGNLYYRNAQLYARQSKEQFKNRTSKSCQDWDTPLSPELQEMFETYWREHRPHLLCAGESDLIFLPAPREGARKPTEEDPIGILLSYGIRKLSQRYIPGCPGFGIHSLRAIVATDILKRFPSDYSLAALALNDSPEVVKKAYCQFVPQDKIAPFTNRALDALAVSDHASLRPKSSGRSEQRA